MAAQRAQRLGAARGEHQREQREEHREPPDAEPHRDQRIAAEDLPRPAVAKRAPHVLRLERILERPVVGGRRDAEGKARAQRLEVRRDRDPGVDVRRNASDGLRVQGDEAQLLAEREEASALVGREGLPAGDDVHEVVAGMDHPR